MIRDRNFDDPELTEDDRIVMRLYEKASPPIPWDESDEAILALSRQSHSDSGLGDGSVPLEDDGADGSDGDDNVIPFEPHRQSFINRVMHSPAAGFSIAASLMIGIFVGQGSVPYVDLGVSPAYNELKNENSRLSGKLRQTRALRTRSIDTTPAVAPGVGAPVAGAPLARIAQALGGYECANLQARVSVDQRVLVTGFVSRPEDFDRLGVKLTGISAGGGVANEVRVHAWPFCQALNVLYTDGGARANTQRLPVVRPLDHGSSFVHGERLVVEASATAAYDGYVYVDFVQQNGKVIHALWVPEQTGRSAPAGQRLVLGAEEPGFTIVSPFGTEMMVVVSSPTPLFSEPRPQEEDVEAYFADLREAMIKANKADERRQVVSTYHFITTGPTSEGQK